jgi:hypothetical protein
MFAWCATTACSIGVRRRSTTRTRRARRHSISDPARRQYRSTPREAPSARARSARCAPYADRKRVVNPAHRGRVKWLPRVDYRLARGVRARTFLDTPLNEASCIGNEIARIRSRLATSEDYHVRPLSRYQVYADVEAEVGGLRAARASGSASSSWARHGSWTGG